MLDPRLMNDPIMKRRMLAASLMEPTKLSNAPSAFEGMSSALGNGFAGYQQGKLMRDQQEKDASPTIPGMGLISMMGKPQGFAGLFGNLFNGFTNARDNSRPDWAPNFTAGIRG